MINHNVSQSHWVTSIHEVREAQKSGTFTSSDKDGRPVVLEWMLTDILSPELALAKKDVADLAACVTAEDETRFLRAHPEAVSQEMFLKPCEPLFASGHEMVDWAKVEQTIQATIKQFYCIDMSSFGDALKPLLSDVIIFVSIKEADRLLGYMIASVTQALPYGDVKLISLVVEPEVREKHLEGMLVAVLIKIVPGVERIFTSIRPTSRKEKQLFQSLGFMEDMKPVEDPMHKINPDFFSVLEYRLNRATVLQEAVAELVE